MDISGKAIDKVDIEISVVIGRAAMPIHQLLRMGRGAVIELDAMVDDHVWVYANQQLIARGEINVNGEYVSVEITETFDMLDWSDAAASFA